MLGSPRRSDSFRATSGQSQKSSRHSQRGTLLQKELIESLRDQSLKMLSTERKVEFYKLLEYATCSQMDMDDQKLLENIRPVKTKRPEASRASGLTRLSRNGSASSNSAKRSANLFRNRKSSSTFSSVSMNEEESVWLSKLRFKELGELFSISFELNGTNLLSCAIAANNLRAVRFFCFILDKYDNLELEVFEDDGEGQEAAALLSRRNRNGLKYCLSMYNSVGNTPLLIAAEAGLAPIVEELILRGANMAHKNLYRMNALHLAVEGDRKATVKMLLDFAPTHLTLDESEEFSKIDMNYPLARADADNGDMAKLDKFNRAMWLNTVKTKILNVVQVSMSLEEYLQKLCVKPIDNRYQQLNQENEQQEREQKNRLKIGVIEGSCSVVSFEQRRIIHDPITSVKCVYEFQPFIKTGKDDKPKSSNLWFTKEEISRWPSFIASALRSMIEAFQASEDSKMIYMQEENGAIRGDKRELRMLPLSIISRECTAASRKYHVSWPDENILTTCHTAAEMFEWTHEGKYVGKDLIERFDSIANDIVRVYLNSRNKYGKSPFISMCEFGKFDIFKLVLDACDGEWATAIDSRGYMKEALVYSSNGLGATSLHFAVKTQRYDLVNALLSKVKDKFSIEECARMISTPTRTGDTPLHWLAEMADEESIRIVHLLLDTLEKAGRSVEDVLNHIEPNSTPNSTNNYLMRAAKAGNMELCKVLLAKNADKFEGGVELFETDDFKTAAEFAFESKFFDLSYYLNKNLGMKAILSEFLLRCHTNVRFEYLSEAEKLYQGIHDKEMVPDIKEKLKDEDKKKLSPDALFELLNVYEELDSGHRYHEKFREIGWSVESDLFPLGPADEDDLLLTAMSHLLEEDPSHKKRLQTQYPFAYETHYQHRKGNLFTLEVYPKGGTQNQGVQTFLVRKVDKKPRGDREVCQSAMDHYMSRKDLFCRISRMSASDDATFNDLLRIIKGSKIPQPAIFCNEVLKSLYMGFRDDDEVSDIGILARLMKLNSALDSAKSVADHHHVHFFENEMKKILYVLRVMFETTALNDQENLRKILLTEKSIEKYKVDEVEIGRGVYGDVLSNALYLKITALFGTPQVAAYFDQLLRGNLMSDREGQIKYAAHRDLNIFSPMDVLRKQVQHHSASGYEHVRYSPINMFMLELVSKLFFLAQVSYVSNYEYGSLYNPPNEPHDRPQTYTIYDYGIVIQLIATLIRELGEYLGSTAEKPIVRVKNDSSIAEQWLQSFYENVLMDVWNFVDMAGVLLVAIWAITKNFSGEKYEVVARGALACAAIPQAFGILYYAFIEKEMGNLVITVVSMSRDLYSFLVVLVICMFGFGITLRSLFQHDHEKREDEDYSGVNLIEGFSTITSTQITLWDAMLGQHDFNQIDGNSPYFVLGIILMGTFILLTMIILFNLLIAKMSTTYEQKEKASLEDWEYEKAQIVNKFLLIGERSPFSMLPAPLNLITTFVHPFHWAIINRTLFGSIFGRSEDCTTKNDDKARVISLAGTMADYILGFVFTPLAACYEIVSDILHMTFSVFDYFEEVRKKMQENITRSQSISSETPGASLTWSFVAVTALFIGHLVLHLLSSPFLFLYYCFKHMKVIFSKTVQLEFAGPTGDELRIIYPLDKGNKYTPKRNIENNVFRGKFIRGKISRFGNPFDHRPTVVRVRAGPYSYETAPAVLDCPKKMRWKDLPTNTKHMVSFPENEVVVPAFPFGGNDLIRHLEIDVVEQHASGEKILASCHVPGVQLHRWVYNGRYEGTLHLVNHDEILLHKPMSTSGKDGQEVILVSGPKLKRGLDESRFHLDEMMGPATAHRACKVSIERDLDGVVTNISFTPGSGYSEADCIQSDGKSSIRVFHFLRTGWFSGLKRADLLAPGSMGTEGISAFEYSCRNQGTLHSMRERTKSQGDSPPELWCKNVRLEPDKDGTSSPVVKYLALNQGQEDENLETMKKDLSYLKSILEHGPGNMDILDIFGEKVAGISKASFGLDKEFDTICMATMQVKLIQRDLSYVETMPGGETLDSTQTESDLRGSRKLYPVLANLKSAAEVQVAFSFSVNMSTHLASAAEEELDLLERKVVSVGANTSSGHDGKERVQGIKKSPSTEILEKLVLSSGISAKKVHPTKPRVHDAFSQIDHALENSEHSRFDSGWAEHLDVPRLFTLEERKTMFNFIDGDMDYLNND